MHPILFKFTIANLEFPIYSAQLFGFLGYLAAGVFFYIKARRLGLDKHRLLAGIILGFLVFCFAGKIFLFIYNWYRLGSMPNFFSTGYMSYSSILIFILFVCVYCKRNKWSIYQILDIYALANLLESAINRIGCFLNGCCFGKPTELFLGCRFPTIAGVPDVLRHPTQIYSSIANLILFFVLLYVYNRKRKFDGQIFWLYVLYYSIFRLFIEFIRTNPLFLLGLTHAQFVSFFAIIASFFVLRFLRKQSASRNT